MRERRTCLIRIANRRCLNDDRERNQIGTRAQLRRCKMLWLVEQSCQIWEINQGRWHWHITLPVNLWRLGRYAHLLSLSHRFNFLLFLFFILFFFQTLNLLNVQIRDYVSNLFIEWLAFENCCQIFSAVGLPTKTSRSSILNFNNTITCVKFIPLFFTVLNVSF